MRTPQPRSEGLHHFTGIRRTATRAYIVTVNDICEAFYDQRGDTKHWYVCFMGRATKYAVDLFDGTFELLDLDLGERQS